MRKYGSVKQSIDVKRFIAAWNEGTSCAALGQRFGRTESAIAALAKTLRRKGHALNLRHPPPPRIRRDPSAPSAASKRRSAKRLRAVIERALTAPPVSVAIVYGPDGKTPIATIDPLTRKRTPIR